MPQLTELIAELTNSGFTLDAGILAGGRSTRMGGKDKGLITLDKGILISSSLNILRPLARASEVMINCNREFDRYRVYSSRICSDSYPEYPGPLAGLHALLETSKADLVFIMPCDTPFVDEDLLVLLVGRALQMIKQGEKLRPIAFQCDQYKHPLHCCLPQASLDSIAQSLQQGQHKLVRWFEDNEAVWVNVSNERALTNINTPEELSEAEQTLLNT